VKIAKLNIEGYIGELDEKSAFAGEKNFTLANLKTFLSSLSTDITDIHYTVNSGGGSVYDGWDMYDTLKASGKNLTSIGEGIVGSIATVIFLAAKPENRKLIKGTGFFVHNPYWLPEESEPMRANELLALGKDLKGEQDKILGLYTKESKATASELAPFLDKETNLTSEAAVKMGFAFEEIEDTEDVVYHQYKLVAMIKPKTTKTNNMDQSLLNKVNKLFGIFNRVRKGKYFDMQITATNSNGDAVELIVESDTEDLTGKPAYIVDVDGNQTPAPDGNYKDADGKTIKVSGGNVTEVVAKVDDTNTATIDSLKAENEALKAEKETLTASLQAKETELVAVKNEFEAFKPQFEAMKNTIIGEGAEFDTATQQFKAKKTVIDNPNQGFLDSMATSLKKK
jgi:ATP-dependent Clp protease protease subunit